MFGCACHDLGRATGRRQLCACRTIRVRCKRHTLAYASKICEYLHLHCARANTKYSTVSLSHDIHCVTFCSADGNRPRWRWGFWRRPCAKSHRKCHVNAKTRAARDSDVSIGIVLRPLLRGENAIKVRTVPWFLYIQQLHISVFDSIRTNAIHEHTRAQIRHINIYNRTPR